VRPCDRFERWRASHLGRRDEAVRFLDGNDSVHSIATERWPVYGGPDWIPGPTEIAEYAARQKEGATTVLANVKAAADRLGVEAEAVHVPEAQPADAIIATAKERHCDLIVMASHGRRGLRRLLLGSQTSEVLVSSPVPVLVVR